MSHLDTAKAVHVASENACLWATMLLTTYYLVTDERRDKNGKKGGEGDAYKAYHNTDKGEMHHFGAVISR